MMLSLDTETTGLDVRHAARPFFVTICHEDGNQQFWEWSVDPLTRRPEIPEKDKIEIREILRRTGGWSKFSGDVAERHALAMQNGKFDAAALESIGIADFPWPAVRDTLIAGHLLASNQRHNLTDMCIQYLGALDGFEDIQPFEDRLADACKRARTWCRRHRKNWLIADAGIPGFPSIKKTSSGKGEKDKNWKNDMWLPRAVAIDQKWTEPRDDCEHVWMQPTLKSGALPQYLCRRCLGHRWHVLLREYSNADSETTLLLWMQMREELRHRKLWRIFEERMRVIPIAVDVERNGVTVNKMALSSQRKEYRAHSEAAGRRLIEIAESYGYDLELPKGAVNDSVREFCLDVMQLEPVYSSKAKTASPTLDAKNAIPYYLATLETGSKERSFIETLVEKRERDTALQFMDSYERYWVPLGILNVFGQQLWYRIHPTLNPTGSDTLRWSSQNPNAQQISKKKSLNLRRCFGPMPGREWWSLDAKNIELRIPAYESGEQELIDLFEKCDEPPYFGSEHLLNFSTIYPELWADAVRQHGDEAGKWIKSSEGYESSNYQWCKNFDFAVGYGAGDETADKAARREGSRRLVLQRFAKKEILNQRWIRFAEQRGYVETIPDRDVDRYHGYPILCSRTEWGGIKPTVPLNYHVQGTAMWWMMRAMIRCSELLTQWRREGFDGRMILQVHDELVFDFPRGTGSEPWQQNSGRIREIARAMERGGDGIGIPTPVSIEWHDVSWADGKSIA